MVLRQAAMRTEKLVRMVGAILIPIRVARGIPQCRFIAVQGPVIHGEFMYLLAIPE